MSYCTDFDLASAVAALRIFTVVDVVRTTDKQSPPAPFNMSSLIQSADNHLHFTADQTKDLAQKLFESGHITYHRGDSINLSEYGFDMLQAYAKANNLGVVSTKRTWEEKAGSQQGHEAIRPSDFSAEVAGSTRDEQMLYNTIRLRALASQMEAAEFAVHEITLESVDTVVGAAVKFLAKARVMTSPGWKRLVKTDHIGVGQGGEQNYAARLPTLEIGQRVTALSGEIKHLITKAPERYSEGSLVGKMESLGIGRPGTYASAIKTIKTKEYAVIKQRFFHASEIGISAVGMLSKNFSFLDYKYTAMMEDRLDDITSGKVVFVDTVRDMHQDLGKEVKEMGSRVGGSYPCPKCGAELRIRKGPRGQFWGCSTFPVCKGVAEDKNGVPALEKRSIPNA